MFDATGGISRRLRSLSTQNGAARQIIFCLENWLAMLRPSHVHVSASRDPGYRVAAMVRVKNEARFIPEWVAHHFLLGVTHFYIYDNGSDDDLEHVLAPLISRDIVTLRPWPISPVSPSADLDFLAGAIDAAEWVAFLDADEFIVEREPGAFIQALESAGSAPALAFNWRFFGSARHEVIPPGLILREFEWADAHLDRHVKVVARTKAIHRYRNPHNFYYKRGAFARDTSERRVIASFSEPRVSAAEIEVRHFVYRSREDYVRKTTRGFAERRGALDAARRIDRVDEEFYRHNEVRMPVDGHVLAKIESCLLGWGYGAPHV